MTQIELAKTLAHYEGGGSRLPIALLPAVAKAVSVSTDTLLGEGAKRSASKRVPAPMLQQQLDQVTQLPKTQQKFVMQMLETVLAQASR